MLTREQLLKQVSFIPSWISENEKWDMYQQACQVPVGGKITEIGCLFGSSTACLALGAPTAEIVSYDNFCWQPIPVYIASEESTLDRLSKIGIKNVKIINADSMALPAQTEPIDLLWIDANHQFEYVLNDLDKFGPVSKVILLHDYSGNILNPAGAQPGVSKAVEVFLLQYPTFKVDHVTDSLAVLCKIQ